MRNTPSTPKSRPFAHRTRIFLAIGAAFAVGWLANDLLTSQPPPASEPVAAACPPPKRKACSKQSPPSLQACLRYRQALEAALTGQIADSNCPQPTTTELAEKCEAQERIRREDIAGDVIFDLGIASPYDENAVMAKVVDEGCTEVTPSPYPGDNALKFERDCQRACGSPVALQAPLAPNAKPFEPAALVATGLTEEEQQIKIAFEVGDYTGVIHGADLDEMNALADDIASYDRDFLESGLWNRLTALTSFFNDFQLACNEADSDGMCHIMVQINTFLSPLTPHQRLIVNQLESEGIDFWHWELFMASIEGMGYDLQCNWPG